MEAKTLCTINATASIEDGKKEYNWSLSLTYQFNSYILSVSVEDKIGTSKETKLTYTTKSDAVKAFNEYAMRFTKLS